MPIAMATMAKEQQDRPLRLEAHPTRDEARRIAANIAKLLDAVLDAGPLSTTPCASALAEP